MLIGDFCLHTEGMATPDLVGVVQSVGQGPAAVTSDGLSVTQQPVAAVIQADRYLAAKAARGKKQRGLLFSKLIPAGAMPDSQGTLGGVIGFNSGGLL